MVAWRHALLAALTLHGERAAAQSVEDMLAKAEAEKEARLEARMERLSRLGADESGDLETAESAAAAAPDAGARFPDHLFYPDGTPRPTGPPLKRIPLKRARLLMKVLVDALFDVEAQAEIDEARFRAMQEAKELAASEEDMDEEDRIEPVDPEKAMEAAVLRAVGPIVERLTKKAAESFGFAGGFEQALASIQDARERKDDAELNAGFTKIVELFYPTGQRIPALHDMVRGFANASAEDQAAAMLDLQHRISVAKQGSEKSTLETYLVAMKGIQAQGLAYVKKTLEKLVIQARTKQAAGDSIRREDKAAFDLQFDVLTHFLSPQGEKDLDESLGKLLPNSEL